MRKAACDGRGATRHGRHGPWRARHQRIRTAEHGNPLVDMQAMMADVEARRSRHRPARQRPRGATYCRLSTAAFPDPDGREPGRTVELHLTGHMERFAWSLRRHKFSDAAAAAAQLRRAPAHRAGQRHDDDAPDPPARHVERPGERRAATSMVRKHTIDMPPGTRRSYRVTADALGRWAYHCHLLYHMEAGMMREVRVSE